MFRNNLFVRLHGSGSPKSFLTSWTLKVVPKDCLEAPLTTSLCCVTSQKSEDLINPAAEAWNQTQSDLEWTFVSHCTRLRVHFKLLSWLQETAMVELSSQEGVGRCQKWSGWSSPSGSSPPSVNTTGRTFRLRHALLICRQMCLTATP
jgi:hypothetical protein